MVNDYCHGSENFPCVQKSHSVICAISALVHIRCLFECDGGDIELGGMVARQSANVECWVYFTIKHSH